VFLLASNDGFRPRTTQYVVIHKSISMQQFWKMQILQVCVGDISLNSEMSQFTSDYISIQRIRLFIYLLLHFIPFGN